MKTVAESVSIPSETTYVKLVLLDVPAVNKSDVDPHPPNATEPSDG
jgi:hypothetical protein